LAIAASQLTVSSGTTARRSARTGIGFGVILRDQGHETARQDAVQRQIVRRGRLPLAPGGVNQEVEVAPRTHEHAQVPRLDFCLAAFAGRQPAELAEHSIKVGRVIEVLLIGVGQEQSGVRSVRKGDDQLLVRHDPDLERRRHALQHRDHPRAKPGLVENALALFMERGRL
jgi:hypothetical protein